MHLSFPTQQISVSLVQPQIYVLNLMGHLCTSASYSRITALPVHRGNLNMGPRSCTSLSCLTSHWRLAIFHSYSISWTVLKSRVRPVTLPDEGSTQGPWRLTKDASSPSMRNYLQPDKKNHLTRYNLACLNRPHLSAVSFLSFISGEMSQYSDFSFLSSLFYALVSQKPSQGITVESALLDRKWKLC